MEGDNQQQGNVGGGVPPQTQPVVQPQPQPQPQPVPMQQPVPVQQPVLAQPQPAIAPIVPKMDPRQKKIVVLVCSIGGALLVLGILAIIFIPMLFRVDYKATYEAMGKAEDLMSEVNSYDACDGMAAYMTSSYTTKKEFDGYVTACKDALSGLEGSISDLSGQSGITRDEDIKEKWNAFKTVWDKVKPALDKMVVIAPAVHNFTIDWSEVADKDGEGVTDGDIDGAVKHLIDSGNETLKDYGTELAALYKRYISAYKDYDSKWNAYLACNTGSCSEELDVYHAARDAYSDVSDEVSAFVDESSDKLSDSVTIIGLDMNDDENDFSTPWRELRSIISEKYYEYENDTLDDY